MKWPTGALDSIAILDRQSIHPSQAEAATPYLGLEHLDGDGGINCIQTVGSAGLKSNKFQFSDRHVLFGKLRPYLRKIARPEFSGVCSTDIIPILPKDGVLRDYLFYFLRTPDTVNLATSRCSGANLPRLSPKQLASFQIPLPPLAEQKRIAGILDAADALRAKRREALAQLDTLIQFIFIEMFGDPVTNPMGWSPTLLSAISEELRDGPFGSNLKSSHYVERGVRVIRLQNIGVGEIRNDDLAFISEEHFASLPRNHCQPGDVIIATMGDPNLRACIVPLALARALNKADCILMRVDMTKVDAIYVCWLLNNPRMVSMALQLVRGQTRGRISLGRLKELQIHLPPIELQLRFAAIVKSVEQQKASQRAHLAELDTLFASLQSRAFRGDL